MVNNIKIVAVIGIGFLGYQIASQNAQHDYTVRIYDVRAEILEKLAKKFDWSLNYDTDTPRPEGIPIDYRFSKWCLDNHISIMANMHNIIYHHKPFGVNPGGKRMKIIHEFEALAESVPRWE